MTENDPRTQPTSLLDITICLPIGAFASEHLVPPYDHVSEAKLCARVSQSISV